MEAMFDGRNPAGVYCLNITQQGDLLKVENESSPWAMRNSSGGVRGIVTKFSRASRSRMIELFATFDRAKINRGKQRVKFITLTYEDNMTDHAQAKRDLKVFVERLQERWGIWLVWRMEKQERGAIHFHLMVGNMPFVHVQELQKWWNEVTGQTALNSLDLDVIRSLNGVMFYCAKYMAKDESKDEEPEQPQQRPLGLSVAHIFSHPSIDISHHECYERPMSHYGREESTGRWWGVYGRAQLPLAEKRVWKVPLQLNQLKTWVAALESDYASSWQSFKMFTPIAGMYLDLLDWVLSQDEVTTQVASWRYWSTYHQPWHEQCAIWRQKMADKAEYNDVMRTLKELDNV